MKTLDRIWLALLGTAALLYCVATRTEVFFASILISGILCVALIAIGRKEGYTSGQLAGDPGAEG